jgi:hypothetical protein
MAVVGFGCVFPCRRRRSFWAKKNSLAMTPEREKGSVRLTETLLAHSGREDYGYNYEAGERNEGLCAGEFHWFLPARILQRGDCVNINISGQRRECSATIGTRVAGLHRTARRWWTDGLRRKARGQAAYRLS